MLDNYRLTEEVVTDVNDPPSCHGWNPGGCFKPFKFTRSIHKNTYIKALVLCLASAKISPPLFPAQKKHALVEDPPAGMGDGKGVDPCNGVKVGCNRW